MNKNQNSTQTTTTSKKRGFAAMEPSKVSAIASKGGKAAHAAGTAHEFSPDEARAAGRLGGLAVAAKRRQPAPAFDGGHHVHGSDETLQQVISEETGAPLASNANIYAAQIRELRDSLAKDEQWKADTNVINALVNDASNAELAAILKTAGAPSDVINDVKNGAEWLAFTRMTYKAVFSLANNGTTGDVEKPIGLDTTGDVSPKSKKTFNETTTNEDVEEDVINGASEAKLIDDLSHDVDLDPAQRAKMIGDVRRWHGAPPGTKEYLQTGGHLPTGETYREQEQLEEELLGAGVAPAFDGPGSPAEGYSDETGPDSDSPDSCEDEV